MSLKSDTILFLHCEKCDDYVKVEHDRICSCGISKVSIEDGELFFSEETAVILSIPESMLLNGKKKAKKISAEDKLFVVRVIEYLNAIAETTFSLNRSSTHSDLILSRKKDGFVYDDFVKVINKKVSEWKGTSQQIYLRPSTLFAKRNFENYVGEKEFTPGNSTSTFEKFRCSVDAAKGGVFEGG